jgi:type II secretory pathway component GspD/PulD (secretin)
MKISRWLLLLVLLGNPLANHDRMLRAAEQGSPGSTSKDGIHFDRAPLEQFIGAMIRRLRIDVVIIHNVALNSPVTIHKDTPVSDQELLDLFITGLRSCDAAFVKNGAIYQIVPSSQNPHEGWDSVVSLPQPVRALPSGVRILINFENLDFSSLLAEFLDSLNLTPIVVSPYVGGSATILSSASIDRTRMLELLMALLKNSNAKLIESGGKHEIIPAFRPVPAGWTEISQPPLLKPGIRKQRKSLNQQELKTHILYKIDPKLSRTAGQPTITGRVKVEVCLNEHGDTDILQVLQTYGRPTSLLLAEAAIEAVRQWEFAPFMGADGQPERVTGLITVIFSDAGVEYDYGADSGSSK